MKSAGVGLNMEKTSVGLVKIKCRGLSVFVGQEEIVIFEGKWKNAEGVFETLEEAVLNALPRWGGKNA